MRIKTKQKIWGYCNDYRVCDFLGYCRDLLRRIGIGIAYNQCFIVGFGAVCTGAMLGIFGFALNTGY